MANQDTYYVVYWRNTRTIEAITNGFLSALKLYRYWNAPSEGETTEKNNVSISQIPDWNGFPHMTDKWYGDSIYSQHNKEDARD